MSKQSEAKERQQYVAKCIPQTCGRCVHFESVVTQEPAQWGGTWTKETSMRCAIGGFKVMRMGTCTEWGGKP